MKQEDLIKKLENIILPKTDVYVSKIENHKQELRSTLLNSGYFVPKNLIWELNESKIMFWTKRLSPAGLAFVLIFFLGLGMIQAKSQVVRAMEVAQNDPQIVEIMEEYGVDVRDVRLINDKPYILLGTIEEELMTESVRLTPDSRLYFLKRISEGLGTLLTFGDEAKAERYAKLANRRLVETKMMIDEDGSEAIENVLARYEEQLEKSLKRVERAKERGKDVTDVTEVVARATTWHISVLDEVLDRVPEQAREAIEKAKEVSANSQINALNSLATNSPEKAMEINLRSTEVELDRVKVRATGGDIEGMERAIRDYEGRARINEDILQIARDFGQDTVRAEQILEKATGRHLGILSEVYKKVPEEAKEGIERAMEYSNRERERVMESSRMEENRLPVEIPVQTREKVQQGIQIEIDEKELDETGEVDRERIGVPELPITSGR